MKVIEGEYSSDMQQLIKTIFYANISPSEYFATRIRKAVEGIGTDEKILNRVVITRHAVDMDIIREYYKLLYSRNLVDDVKGDTSGSYQKLLLALIEK
jgi:annexin A7/11